MQQNYSSLSIDTSNVSPASHKGQYSLLVRHFLDMFLYFLSLPHAKTKHFFLFTYCRKCILFEIKMIKDYTFPDFFCLVGFGFVRFGFVRLG